MEKRFYLGAGLLVLFLVLGLWVSGAMNRVCAPVVSCLEQAAREALDGKLQEAERLAGEGKRLWQENWHGIAALADHSPMDEIDGLLAQMEFFAQAEQQEAFGACCSRLTELVEAVADAHRLTWWNLL